MSVDVARGLRKVGEAQSAVISHEVTEEAQVVRDRAQAEIDASQGI